MLWKDILNHIDQLKEQHIPIVVEGREDRKALEYFEITTIIVLYTKPFYKIIEYLQKFPEIAVLTE